MLRIEVCAATTIERGDDPVQIAAFLAARSPATRARKPPAFLSVLALAPTEADWHAFQQSFDFHPLALEDARKKGQRAKVDDYGGYFFVSVSLPTRAEAQELDMFVGPDYFVALADAETPVLDELERRLQRATHSQRRTPGFLLYALLDALVDDCFPLMDDLDARIDALETQVYQPGAEFDLAPALSLKKELLLLRQAVAPLRDILNILLRGDSPKLIAPELRVYFLDVFDHALRLIEQIDLHRDLLGTVMDASVAQTGNRLNQVMKAMTGISTILMSAALIAGIYGMNFKAMPELGWRYGYPLALGSMVAVGGILALLFRKNRWF